MRILLLCMAVVAFSLAVPNEQNLSLLANYEQELKQINKEIPEDSTWVKNYSSYMTAVKVSHELALIQKKIKILSKKRTALSQQERDELNALRSKESVLSNQMLLLKGKEKMPFANLIIPPKISHVPEINSPLDLFAGFSFIKQLDQDYDNYLKQESRLQSIIKMLEKKKNIYTQMLAIEEDKIVTARYHDLLKQLSMFKDALETINATENVYKKRIEVIEVDLRKKMEEQIYKLVKIGIFIVLLFFVTFLLKLIIKRYITDNERFYMANKIITFANFTLILLVLFANYITNIGYLVTILGFASAGIAIAMKDWFMSILGWLVLVVGGSIHVGDRIRVDMDGMKYIGDVLDISLLRITILEDITLTSVETNRRAGRIIFIPNNYVFTKMIANYSHYALKTVWDGIDVTITFNSNHKRAMQICKEITRKYSKGYTDMTRKQLNNLRNHYSLKNANVEPRIYSFIKPNGILISSWYLTNAYGTLTLRSSISTEIIDEFNKADDITISYPTQRVYLGAPASEIPSELKEI